MLPEHAHLSPVLARLQELSGWSTLLGAGVLASQGRRVGRPGGLHDPHLCQHDGSLQAPSKPGESGCLAQMNSEAVETHKMSFFLNHIRFKILLILSINKFFSQNHLYQSQVSQKGNFYFYWNEMLKGVFTHPSSFFRLDD